jgi:archaellum component FlaD/FlaE
VLFAKYVDKRKVHFSPLESSFMDDSIESIDFIEKLRGSLLVE